MMTFYQLLRRLTQQARMGETETNDAYALIDKLEAVNAFSTITQKVKAQGHECYFDPFSHNCIYCNTKQGELYKHRTHVR